MPAKNRLTGYVIIFCLHNFHFRTLKNTAWESSKWVLEGIESCLIQKHHINIEYLE
jgi:coenzyme F420-reducing hydrogenase beta subunit